MLVETTDFQRIAKTIASEVATAVQERAIPANAVPVPDPGILEVCAKQGDRYFVNPAEPRIAVTCHPLSKTEMVILHHWGPSEKWLDMMIDIADALLALQFVTTAWAAGNPLSDFAVKVTGATLRPDGLVGVDLAVGRARLVVAKITK